MPDVVFYDGECGLCHGAVRFFLRRDATDLRFAPLGGPTFQQTIPPRTAATLPDSIVVRTADGSILVRSHAILYLMRRLSMPYRVLAAIGSVFPTGLLDSVYDVVARVRVRLFSRPAGACPMVPAHLRRRFDP